MFLLGTAALFVLDESGALPALIDAAEPLVSGWLGLPARGERCVHPRLPAAGLRRHRASSSCSQDGQLTAEQAVVAMVTITLFIPCIASVLVIARERGWRTAAAMTATIFPFAFLVGGLLRRSLSLAGWGVRASMGSATGADLRTISLRVVRVPLRSRRPKWLRRMPTQRRVPRNLLPCLRLQLDRPGALVGRTPRIAPRRTQTTSRHASRAGLGRHPRRPPPRSEGGRREPRCSLLPFSRASSCLRGDAGQDARGRSDRPRDRDPGRPSRARLRARSSPAGSGSPRSAGRPARGAGSPTVPS